MNYTLNQLRIFYKLVQTKNITKAAEELHLTQPAVSIQLKNFQKQFEIPLTETVNKRIYITEFGQEIAQVAEKILEDAAAINDKLMSFKGQLTGKLKISVVSTGKYVMPYFLGSFLKQNPGVNLILDVTNRSKVAEHLASNEVDFALVSILPDPSRVESVDLLENKLVLVGNPLLKSEIWQNQNPNILESLTLIYREEGSATRYIMEDFIQAHGLQVNKKIELTSNEAVKQSVIAGPGLSIMPLIGIRNEIENGLLKIIPMKGLPIQTTWRLIWLKEKRLSPIAESYLQYLEKEKENITKNYFSLPNHQ